MNFTKKLFLILLLLPIHSFALTYTCPALYKVGFEHVYTKEELEKFSPFTLLEISEDNITHVSRCIYFNKKLQCTKMLVDKIERDKNINLTKYYVFESQYNFQIFHDLSALEDNGRGDISYEKCTMD